MNFQDTMQLGKEESDLPNSSSLSTTALAPVLQLGPPSFYSCTISAYDANRKI